MGIISLDEYKAAVGLPSSSCSQDDQLKYYINSLSAAIETYTGVSFTLHTDEELKMVSDYYGEIKLGMKPIQSVSSLFTLNEPVTSSICNTWGFDEFDTIFNLRPHTAYIVKLTYGYEEAPADIKGYVVESVRQKASNPTGATSFKVGDVEERWGSGGSSGGAASSSYQRMQDAVLESYKDTEETWKLGPRAFTPQPTNQFS
jgi:hypothetical protein